MPRGPSVALLLLICGCSSAALPEYDPGPPAGSTPAGPAATPTPPHGDYHRHLRAPAVAARLDGAPMLPEIALPAELDRLLRERAERWNDSAALADLFTADARVLGRDRSGWLHGDSAAAAQLSRTFASGYRLTPTSLVRDGATAQISGYYSRGPGDSPVHIGYFLVNARREADGRWRIAAEVPRFPVAPLTPLFTADRLVADLDDAGIRRAAVLSEAFWLDGPLLPTPDPYAGVAAVNDWTALQVARFPDRLVGFCSFNPVADHALAELERCAGIPSFRGLKFSFAMSAVDLRDAHHLTRVKRVFAAANRHRLPIVVHLRGGHEYGAEQVRIFLDEVMPLAPDIVVQVAHLWGGEGFSAEALATFADAVAAGAPATRNLYFDVAEIWLVQAPAELETIAREMRRIGLERIVFGSDDKTPAARAWWLLQRMVPLTPEEFERIAQNVAPHLQPR